MHCLEPFLERFIIFVSIFKYFFLSYISVLHDLFPNFLYFIWCSLRHRKFNIYFINRKVLCKLYKILIIYIVYPQVLDTFSSVQYFLEGKVFFTPVVFTWPWIHESYIDVCILNTDLKQMSWLLWKNSYIKFD